MQRTAQSSLHHCHDDAKLFIIFVSDSPGSVSWWHQDKGQGLTAALCHSLETQHNESVITWLLSQYLSGCKQRMSCHNNRCSPGERWPGSVSLGGGSGASWLSRWWICLCCGMPVNSAGNSFTISGRSSVVRNISPSQLLSRVSYLSFKIYWHRTFKSCIQPWYLWLKSWMHFHR